MTETFIKERKHNLTGKVEPVGIDDASAVLCRFENGSLGDVRGHALRPRPQGALHARGQRREDLGPLGSSRPASAAVFRSPRRRPSPRLAQRPHHRRRSALHEAWWVPGLQIGYEHTFIHQFADFVDAAAEGKPLPPTFRDGLATDFVTDAI